MSERELEMVGEEVEFLSRAVQLGLDNSQGQSTVKMWTEVEGTLWFVRGDYQAWRIRSKKPEWHSFPAPIGPAAIAEMAMAWIAGLDLGEWPEEPICDGSLGRGWKLNVDLDGTIAIAPTWTEYHK